MFIGLQRDFVDRKQKSFEKKEFLYSFSLPRNCK